ncbi:MAG: aromatic aminobenezylarsenical efflux permease ArsG family transporter [bacterium]
MTDPFVLALVSALWLGILTSISPCPMATNVAAMSYIGRRLDRTGLVLLSGILYTLGRLLSYVLIAWLVVASMLSVPRLAFFLQNQMNYILGPLLIIVGVFLLGVFRFSMPGQGLGSGLQGKVDRFGVWGAGILGLVFALSFCPVTAGLFFGSLIPLALEHRSSLAVPIAFGVGTSLPVVAFALTISLGSRVVGRLFNRLTQFEHWARIITAVAFILVGVYYTLVYIFKVPI